MKKFLVAASISLTLLVSACGSGAKDQAAADLAAGGDRLANLPMGLPLMKGATVAHNNNGAGGPKHKNATATLFSTQSVDDSFEYYQQALENAGFTGGRANDVDDIRTVAARKSNAFGMITVRPAGEKVAVMIVVRDE
jgi:outer membrane murein-binding lipoprotein Lpp